MIASSYSRVSSLLVATAFGVTSFPAYGSAPSPRKGKANATVPAEPATDGRTVAMMRFTGSVEAAELRATLLPSLQEGGYTVKGVALEPTEAAKKVKCNAAPDSDECLILIGQWLNSNPKTAADFIMFGSVTEAPGRRVELVIFDIAAGQRVRTLQTALVEGDLILPIVLPQELVTELDEHRQPPPPPSDEERELIAQLDEPDKTPEEIAAERQAIADAEAAAAAAQQGQAIDTGRITADLRDDFRAFCRDEPRRKRESKDDPKDLRPACKRGPFWGYWQPRGWVALGLTAGAALGTVALYSAALAGLGPYNQAVDALNNYNAAAGGNPQQDPSATTNGGQSYDALATEVSRTGAEMRRRAVIGDVMLGTTALLSGVLAIIIYQDRRDAKQYIKEEKSLRAISDVRVAPMVGRTTGGMGLGFRF